MGTPLMAPSSNTASRNTVRNRDRRDTTLHPADAGDRLQAVRGGRDPRASATSWMMSSFGGMNMAGMGGRDAVADPSDAGMRDTLSEAMTNSARAVDGATGQEEVASLPR
jgi:hypothetical protein